LSYLLQLATIVSKEGLSSIEMVTHKDSNPMLLSALLSLHLLWVLDYVDLILNYAVKPINPFLNFLPRYHLEVSKLTSSQQFHLLIRL
jgi:hypothetical protein